MELHELKVYTQAMDLGEKIWELAKNWNYYIRDTIGKQLVRASDSIAANISEGYGRYFYKENLQFLYYARGSLYETQTWLTKAFNRKLIEKDMHDQLINDIKDLGIRINNYIAKLKRNAKKHK